MPMPTIDPAAWPILGGLLVAIVLGELLVGRIVKLAGDQVGKPKPSEPKEPPAASAQPADTPLDWAQWYDMNTGGSWIGRVERPMFFAALWFQAWVLVSAWLVMKTAFYWQGSNFAALPQDAPSKSEQWKYIVAKRHLGTHHVATALTGTAANIVLALAGIAIAKWVKWT